MMKLNADVDIDFADRESALDVLPHIAASHVVDGRFAKHPSGVYFQAIPTDPLTGYAGLTFKEAAEHGYFKVDVLNNTIYHGVRDAAHLDDLLGRPPDWSLLEDADVVGNLAHIHSHFDVVSQIKPTSILDLAVCLALIRPAKRHLLGKTRSEIDAEIWQPSVDGSYAFKKSHAVAFAASIVVQLNLLVEHGQS